MSIVETEMSAVQRAHVAREGLHFFTLRTLPFEGLDLANDLVPRIQHPTCQVLLYQLLERLTSKANSQYFSPEISKIVLILKWRLR